MTVQVGVIGTGAIGTDHVTRLTTRVAGAAVTAVFDVVTERARAVAAAAGATAHPTWQALVDDPRVHAVVVASPGDLHPEQVLACLDAGKPVLCEKPLATTPAGAALVVDAEARLGRRLVRVGFMRRYDPGYVDLKEAVADGTIGVPLLAHAVHRNAEAPASFTGRMSLTDSVVHELDVFRWLLDGEIAAVTLVPVGRSPLAATGLSDPQVVVVEMVGGQVVTVESFVNCRYGYDVRCEVVGSLGTVSLDTPRTTVVRRAGGRTERVPADWRERFALAYVEELQTWVDGVAAGVVDGPSAWDGLAATTAAACAVESSATRARVDVVLPPRPAVYG